MSESEIRWSGRTHPGRVRKNNEDAFLALTFDELELFYLGKDGAAPRKRDFVFAVSDGMGGANAGEFASRIAVQTITRFLPLHYRKNSPESEPQKVLSELFLRIHAEMKEMGSHYEECKGMGATLSLCWFTPHAVHYAHVGDSRIYRLPAEGSLAQVTQDDTYVEHLVRTGRITKAAARFHPQRNILNQCVGGGVRNIEVQTGSLPCEAGDRIFICSDGVSNEMGAPSIEDYLRKANGTANAEVFVDEILDGRASDNLTALVVAVEA